MPAEIQDNIERQQAHFDGIADTYYAARRNANHLLLNPVWRFAEQLEAVAEIVGLG